MATISHKLFGIYDPTPHSPHDSSWVHVKDQKNQEAFIRQEETPIHPSLYGSPAHQNGRVDAKSEYLSDLYSPFTNERTNPPLFEQDRVPHVEADQHKNQFELFKHPGINYNNTSGYRDALKGQWEDDLLSKAFFSRENMRIIQNGIRAGVYQKSNGRFQVGDQDTTNLNIVFRSVFLQYAEHRPNVREEIKHLNQLVLDYAVENVYNQAQAHLNYTNSISTLPVPHALPAYMSNTGDKLLEIKPWF